MADPDQVAALLDDVTQIRTQAAQTRLERARALMTMPVIREALVRQHLHRELTAERFNIFDILGLRENHHSRFLAFLLDPTAAHDQGARFLRAFVARLTNLPCYGQGDAETTIDWENWSEDDWRRCRVRLENPADEQGRIDVVLYLNNGAVVAIENKVGASEGNNQIAGYLHWLHDCLRNPNNAARLLVFLTPEGREPITANNRGSVLLMSYGDLAEVLLNALEACPPTATPLIATVKQYCNLCSFLHQGASLMCEINHEIINLLEDLQHLETALDIEQHLADAKEKIKNDFRRNFLEALELRLQNDPAQQLWEATSLPEWRDALGLVNRAHCKAVPKYACVVWIGFRSDIHGGWRRPRAIGQPKSPDTEPLEQQMQAAGFGNPHHWWLSVCWLCDEVTSMRQSDFNSLLDWRKANVLAIHTDNQNPDHPLATALANWLWARFTAFHQQIEQLQDFQPD
jgi:hypothetical protein